MSPQYPWPIGQDLPAPEQGAKHVAMGNRAMVSTSHPAVTATAVEVLHDGGNAVDALLTAMLLQHVVEPQMSTLGGGFGLLYWSAETCTATYLNANLDRPAGAPIVGTDTPEASGQRIGVPGTVVGMRALANRFGTRSWESYFAPAIATAEEGFPMYSFLYGEMAAAHDRMTHYPSGREFFTPLGYPTPVGQTHRQPKLAAALRRLSQPDGVEWFQRGEFARHFVELVQATGGAITEADLAGYEARWDVPLHFSAFGHDFLGGPPPEYGPAYTAVGLGILERVGLDPTDHWMQSPHSLVLIARAFDVAERYVTRYCQDPVAFGVPIETLLSDDFLRVQAQLLATSFPHVDLTNPTPSPAAAPQPDQPGPGKTDSNHIVIADQAGNWLTMLHTVFGTPFGTGLVVDGISVNSGNPAYFGGVSLGPGRRITTPLPPVLALHDDRPCLSIGSPGASCHAVSLVLLNMILYGMDLDSAIDAPRFRLRPGRGQRTGWDIGDLAAETRIPTETVHGLGRLGINLAPLGDYNWHMGSIQVVVRDRDTGQLLGAADPRRGGHAAGY